MNQIYVSVLYLGPFSSAGNSAGSRWLHRLALGQVVGFVLLVFGVISQSWLLRVLLEKYI